MSMGSPVICLHLLFETAPTSYQFGGTIQATRLGLLTLLIKFCEQCRLRNKTRFGSIDHDAEEVSPFDSRRMVKAEAVDALLVDGRDFAHKARSNTTEQGVQEAHARRFCCMLSHYVRDSLDLTIEVVRDDFGGRVDDLGVV